MGDGGRYRVGMTTPASGAAEKLVALLETLPAEDRKEIVTWLLGRSNPPVSSAIALAWPPASLSAGLSTGMPPGLLSRIGGEPHEPDERRLRRLAGTLPAGEDSQLITIRLPAERHGELRAWCASHGFTMAAVVRGLVERFLEDQAKS